MKFRIIASLIVLAVLGSLTALLYFSTEPTNKRQPTTRSESSNNDRALKSLKLE